MQTESHDIAGWRRTPPDRAVVRTPAGWPRALAIGAAYVLAYVLLDLKRRDLGIRELVNRLEQAVIDLLLEYGITSNRRSEAPGVYVGEAKIAALGLRITRGCSYHGIALNVDMNLIPFHVIDPCGYPGLAVTQLRDLGVTDSCERVGDKLMVHLTRLLA